MTVDQLIGEIYERLSKADITNTKDRIAIQFNLTGEVSGVFYVEILNGVLSVMPYEYIDHDAIVSGSIENIKQLFTGKLMPQIAWTESKIRVEGNVDKITALAELVKLANQQASEK